MTISAIRNVYHRTICEKVIRIKKGRKGEYPNFADGDNQSSIEIAGSIATELGYSPNYAQLSEQAVGRLFENATALVHE